MIFLIGKMWFGPTLLLTVSVKPSKFFLTPQLFINIELLFPGNTNYIIPYS